MYGAPRFYEIAFDLNRKAEVDFLVHCFKRYARRPVRRVIDMACGTGPHLIRLAERGYRMVGLDLSPKNIEFLRERVQARGHPTQLMVGGPRAWEGSRQRSREDTSEIQSPPQ